MQPAQHTFISYSRADADFALKLARDLRAAGQDIWLDQMDIPPGTRWDREVEQALKTCRRMLIILSPTSSQSENVQDEIGYAFQQKKLIIPVLHQPCDIPFRLQRLQYVDFTKDYDPAFARLLPVMKGTDEEVVRVTGNPTPKLPSSFRKGLAVGGGAVVLLIAILMLLPGPDPVTNANQPSQASQASPSATSYSQPVGTQPPTGAAAARPALQTVELPCEREGSVRSPKSNEAARLSVTNKRNETLRAYWLDFAGKRAAPPLEIGPGETEIQTIKGHFYVVTDQRGDCIKLLKAPGAAVIE